ISGRIAHWSLIKIGAIPMVVTGTHNPYLVALSILVAAFASYTALDLGGHVAAARGLARRVWLGAAAITMGGGIWSMHFVGMLAMRGHAELSYDRLYVALSIVIAIGASTAALWLAFRTTDLGQKLVAAVVMGLAISGMHYTAMRGTIFTAHVPLHEAQGNASLDQTTLALAVAGITFVILAFASIVSLS